MKLESDRRHETDYFTNKFVGKTEELFSGLPKPKEPKWRVKTLLMKLESDRKNSTDYFGSKFTAKVAEIFAGLPRRFKNRNGE